MVGLEHPGDLQGIDVLTAEALHDGFARDAFVVSAHFLLSKAAAYGHFPKEVISVRGPIAWQRTASLGKSCCVGAVCMTDAGDSWKCNCPARDAASAALTPSGSTGPAPAFRIKLSRSVQVLSRTDLVQLEANSCTRLDANCLTFATDDRGSTGDGVARTGVLLALRGAVTRPPSAALTVIGTLAGPPGVATLTLTNDETASGGITLHTRGGAPASTVTMRTLAGTPPDSSVNSGDTSLTQFSATVPRTADDRFALYFGLRPAAYFGQSWYPGRPARHTLGSSGAAGASSPGLPKGYKLEYTGESRQLRTEGNKFLPALFMAMVLIFLVLAAQFNSFRDPLIILLGSVPLAIFGALIFSFLKMPGQGMGFFTDGWTTTLNIYSQVGLVTLVGLVSKNGILIVEFANEQQRRGLPKLQAIREAALVRLRPVLMTSAATICGHFPLTLVSGAGAAARNSIGITIVAGMALGTIFTLLVIPAIYVLIAKQQTGERVNEIEETIDLPAEDDDLQKIEMAAK